MQTANTYLTTKNGTLHPLIQHGAKLQHLSKKLARLLPDFLAGQCTVASWDGDTVIIHANNGAAGTVLRYQLLRLLPLLQQDPTYQKIKHLICHIRPAISTVRNNISALGKPHRSDQAALLLQETAAMISDPKVQAALNRLAIHVKIKQGE